MEANKNYGDSLLAFKILLDDYLKKIYDISIKSPNLDSKPIRALKRIMSINITLNPDDLKFFKESEFRKSCFKLILFRCFGLQYFIEGLGQSSPSDSGINPMGYQVNRLAFAMHNLLYYGIPVLLGLLNRVLWFTVIPFFVFVFISEYRKAKIEYYQTILDRTVPNN